MAPAASVSDADAVSAFKDAMRHLPGGVAVLTVADGDERAGLTATSVVSLSAEPPSLLVNVKRTSSSLPLLHRSGRFAVNLLGPDHGDLADRFAGRSGLTGAARFEGARWIERPGHPAILEDALVSFECEVAETLDRFSHTIIIGLVIASRVHAEADDHGALVYWRAAYDRLL